MAEQRRFAGMTLTIDHDSVTFQSNGFPVVIKKPYGIGVKEWSEFWGGKEQTTHLNYAEKNYTHEGALKSHKEHFAEKSEDEAIRNFRQDAIDK